MKELSIAGKATRYDKALKEAVIAHKDEDKHLKATLERIFPELKESEDEKMIQYFKDLAPFDKADELYEKYGFSHKDAIAWLEKQGEQKPQGKTALEAIKEEKVDNANKVEQKSAWSEEDESILNEAIYFIRREPYRERDAEPIVNWLKTLKGRVQPQLKQEWSEEDKKIIDRIESEFLALHRGEYKNIDFNDVSSLTVLNWVRKIKSLRFQNTWKPSDEQMDALKGATNIVGCKYKSYLNSLYSDLKKLK